MTLEQLMKHISNIYARRNRIFLSGLDQRISFLNLAIGDLQDAIRKDASKKALGAALARVAARVFCVAENFYTLPLIEVMSRKYSLQGCSYCQCFPCACKDKRPEPKFSEAFFEAQLSWSLGQWAQHLNALYGQKNKDKGLENLVNRLFREVAELSAVKMMVYNFGGTLDDIEREFALEIADVLSWTIAIANFLTVDLEKALVDRFGQGCWKCKKNPCGCVGFSVWPVKWDRDTL